MEEDNSGVCCGITFYLGIAAVTLMLYLAYKKIMDDDKLGEVWCQDRDGFGKLFQEYGATVGLKSYQLMLVTKDFQIMREVFVKDFSNFIDRPITPTTLSHVSKSMISLKGQDWKRVRQIISPVYSTGKLKNIYKVIDDRAKKLAQVLEDFARKDKLVPIKHNTSQFTGEVIARSAFGLNSDCQGEQDDEFIYHCKIFFKMQSKSINFIMLLFRMFPKVQRFLVKSLKWRFFDPFDKKADNYFKATLQRSRKRSVKAKIYLRLSCRTLSMLRNQFIGLNNKKILEC